MLACLCKVERCKRKLQGLYNMISSISFLHFNNSHGFVVTISEYDDRTGGVQRVIGEVIFNVIFVIVN